MESKRNFLDANRIAHWLGAAFIVGIATVLLLGAASPSIYTPWTAFKGTNGTTIRTNVSGNLVSIDSSPGVIIASNSLVSQISAAGVWTNKDGFIQPISGTAGQNSYGTNPVKITFVASNNASSVLTLADDVNGSASLPFCLSASMSGSLNNQQLTSTTIYGNYQVPSCAVSFSRTYFAFMGTGVEGQAGSTSSGPSNAVTAIQAYASGNEGLLIGLIAEADPNVNAQTNVGAILHVVDEGKSGPMIGAYVEVGSTGSVDPSFTESCALLIDNRSKPSINLLTIRTNNGTYKVLEVRGNLTTNATPLDVAGMGTFYAGVTIPGGAGLQLADSPSSPFLLTDSSGNVAGGTSMNSVAVKTNTAAFTIFTNAFVLGTRYTNTVAGGFSGGRATIQASFTLNGAAAGTAKVSVYAEQGSLTNRLSISAGPLASLTIIDVLMMRVNPGGIFYFTDETSGAGASVAIVAATSSYFGE